MGAVTMEGMAHSSLPTPTLKPLVVTTEHGLLPIVESAGSCCGGDSCAIGD